MTKVMMSSSHTISVCLEESLKSRLSQLAEEKEKYEKDYQHHCKRR